MGVDEGGIVKVHGHHLVVLRRGRLFTIDTRAGGMQPVDQENAFPPGDMAGRSAWYDEMLVTGDMVVVIGFSYARSGTEINRFHIGDDGQLTYRDTHHLRSGDYYSSENYASRLIGSRLIVYTPLWIDEDGIDSLPGLRRWTANGPDAQFERIGTARNIYVPDLLRNSGKANLEVMHSVTSCDLAAARLNCSATVVLGSDSRTFYVGSDAVYVWTGDLFQHSWDDDSDQDPRGLVYRIPLDGAAPQAAPVWGGPVDQFSLRAEPDGVLHALVRSGYGGDAMWQADRDSRGSIALLSLPRAAFGRGSGQPVASHYQPLPQGPELGSLENRFIGNHLVYAGQYDGRYVNNMYRPYEGPRLAHIVNLADGRVTSLETGAGVSRIDRMGGDAILIGNGPQNSLRFQSIGLDGGDGPSILDVYDLPGSGEAESRSQAFFFRQDDATGGNGVLGLPVSRAVPPGQYSANPTAAGIFYMTRTNRELAPAGQLNSATVASINDGCVASCTDWYGNARPIFLGDRVFALMGYELVEGRLAGGQISETGRISFAPPEPRPAPQQASPQQ